MTGCKILILIFIVSVIIESAWTDNDTEKILKKPTESIILTGNSFLNVPTKHTPRQRQNRNRSRTQT